MLAYWTWVWLAPRPEPRVEASAVPSGNVAAVGSIFGNPPRNQAAAAPTGIAIKLLGVVAASGGRRGYAVVQLDAKQVLAVHEGEDVAPGVRLAEVLADHVILERSGVRETLTWPQKKGSGQAAGTDARRGNEPAAPRVVQPAVPRTVQPVGPGGRGTAGRRRQSD